MPALIFDCDGVLADTERNGHLPAFNQTFAEFGVPVHWTDDDYREKVLIGGGAVLQPVLYSMAVEAALEREVSHGRLFYCTSTGSFFSHPILLDDRSRAAGREVLEVVDRAIETGFLAAAPTEDACGRCDFRPVCGSDVFRRVARKPSEALADLLALRERP